MNHSVAVHREYADLLITMLLCSEFNPSDDKALRKCAKRIRRRLKTDTVKKICHVVMTTNKVKPSIWLSQKLKEIELEMPMYDFFLIARSRAE